MRVLVLGAGGIGGYFGGRLSESGADVTFLVRPARAEAIARRGLVIESPCGAATLAIKTATALSPDHRFDVVLLACKAFDLPHAIEALRPLAGRVVLLPLLNGLAHYAPLDAVFGKPNVLGGLAQIVVTLAADGVVRHFGSLHSLVFGARHPDQQSACDALAALFAPAHVDAKCSAAIEQDLWEKFAFITAASAITCLMRADVGAIVATQDGERVVRAMLAECEEVAAAEGFPSRERARTGALRTLTQPGSPFTASMLRDIRAGQAVEADHLQGDMIRRAEAHGVATPMLRVAYAHLQAYAAARPPSSASTT